jgi:ABC-2 type transport system permease protein
MIATIARIAGHEARASLRDGRLRWSMLMTFALLLAATASGWHYQKELTAERARAQAIEQERWLGQGSKNAHSAAHYGVYAFKPASTLAAIDQGIDPFVGVSVWLEAHHMDQFVYRPAQDGTALTRFGELTAALILQVLMPLVIILLTFSTFAGERERGTLRLLLGQGVSPRVLAAGKVLGTAAVLAVLIVPALALAAAAVMLDAPADTGANGGRLSLLVLVYLAYLAGWALLALAVSAWVSTARAALVGLLGAWILGCLALPRAAADFVAWVHPMPTATEFVEAMERDLDPAHSSDRALARRARVLREYGVDRIENLPIDWRGISLQEEEERDNPTFDAHYGALFDRYRQQSTGLQAAGIVAPLLAAQSLSEVLTGTDIEHHRRFVFAAEAQRRVMQKILNAEVTLRDREDRPDSLSGPELWRRVPAFSYQRPPLGPILQHYWLAFTTLGLWLFGTTIAAAFAVRRLRP